MKDVFAVIMAGGEGSRMQPLTRKRSKPDITIGGKYRLIDIPISNCINSGIHQIAVLTQFNSSSLHRHIASTYNYLLGGSLQILAAYQTPDCKDWYQGNADAFRKQMMEIRNEGAPYTLILSSDHLYRMDYEELTQFHIQKKSDITVAAHPVGWDAVSALGILKSDSDCRVSRFVEKPAGLELQNRLTSREDPEKPFLASMGIYMFNTEVLIDLLTRNPDFVDFGLDVIPQAIHSLGVYSYEFDDYWRDIGTIRSFYDANLALTAPDPPFGFYSPGAPIYSSTFSLPGSILVNSELSHVILSEGCHITGARIDQSIIGSGTRIMPGGFIKDSIIMGDDSFIPGASHTAVGTQIGENCFITGAILDNNVRLGRNVTIYPFSPGVEINHGDWFVCDGIVVIPQGAEIPEGTVIAPVEAISGSNPIQNTSQLHYVVTPGRI